MDLRSYPYKKGCILCGKPLTYGPTRLRVCCLCGLTEPSDCVCPDGHFVCSACHTAELADLLLPVLTQTDERDPLRLLERMMELPAVNLHGPEYHILVPCVLLSAYSRCGGALAMPLEKALSFAIRRARQLPGGICGSWGVCGAAAGAGIFASLVTCSHPLNTPVWSIPQRLSARCLEVLAEVGGPRCCKRVSRLSVQTAVRFAREELGVEMPESDASCRTFRENTECIGTRCPYYPKETDPGRTGNGAVAERKTE
ncbi:MAG: hypothetical protein IJH47_01770 [Oscillospiraceae bacterium]|nr:hypothetical protein [Oscillospiraceae bacterium]